MKVLIGCEFSGRVRDAFKKLGHDAWSCDLIPSETIGNHIQYGDEAQKSTCLWLKNLPFLCPTNIVEKGEMVQYASWKKNA